MKGKGGVFKATSGLQRRFGPDRVFNSPLAEAGIIGRALGMAVRGLKPVTEIQFFDYIWPAMMQLRSELALLRWRSGGNFKCPMVVRVAIGGYLTGGGDLPQPVRGSDVHPYSWAAGGDAVHCARRLRIAAHGGAVDDPVLFLEHKHLYRQPTTARPIRARISRFRSARPAWRAKAADVSIITYGAVVHRAEMAAATLGREGASVEIIDLRTLSPYDWDAVAATVQKTNRVIVAYEDTRSWGYGAEIAARIGDELFDHLDAPVRRVAAKDTFCGYHPKLEDAILPQTEDIERALRELLAY